jgi:hypothetical protein
VRVCLRLKTKGSLELIDTIAALNHEPQSLNQVDTAPNKRTSLIFGDIVVQSTFAVTAWADAKVDLAIRVRIKQ